MTAVAAWLVKEEESKPEERNYKSQNTKVRRCGGWGAADGGCVAFQRCIHPVTRQLQQVAYQNYQSQPQPSEV